MQKSEYQNLNFVRILLATLVTWSHSYPLTKSAEPITAWLSTETGGAIAVKAFFFISGILVARSWVNNPSPRFFLASRILRIWPALLFAILLSIGLAFTTRQAGVGNAWYEIKEYFLVNIWLLGGVDYGITGAFADNPFTSSVNGSLWTLPWELRCYIVLFVLGLVGILKSRVALAIALAGLALAWNLIPAISASADNPEVPLMILCFFAGCLLGQAKVLPSLTGSFVVLCFGGLIAGYIFGEPYGIALAICAGTYVIGFNPKKIVPSTKHDISFGIYVYSYPVQQAILAHFGLMTPTELFLLTMLFVVPLSLASWHWIEAPALRLKRFFKSDFKIAQESLKWLGRNRSFQS